MCSRTYDSFSSSKLTVRTLLSSLKCTMLQYVAVILLLRYTEAVELYQPLVVAGNYSVNIRIAINFTQECIIRFPTSYSKYPYLIYAWSEKNQSTYPVLIMVRQQREATAWEIPLTVVSRTGNFLFYNTSRTLCHNDMDKIREMTRGGDNSMAEYELEKELTVSLSTASKDITNITIRVDEQNDFYLEEYVQYAVYISPSEPRYFYYKYPEKTAENYSSNVILDISSEDDICLTVSIQNASCPVFDLNKDIAFKGKYQTIDTKGGIIIKKTQYRNGFFVVFVAKGDNFDCSQEKSVLPMKNSLHVTKVLSRSLVHFTIKPTIYKDDYLHASVWVIAVTLSFYAVILICSLALLYCERKQTKDKDALSFENQNPNEQRGEMQTGLDHCIYPEATIDELQIKGKLLLCDLTKKGPANHHRKSYNYLWHVLTIAVFYGIPVTQLVFTYQKSVHITGNHDICYYNFLCAHLLYGFSDFNHIFSNIGYVLAGISFLVIITFRNRHVGRNIQKIKTSEEREVGVPNHFGLYYAMAVALIMEGVFSACYHVCPNQSNFQFDTSFMYIMITLCIVKLYQNRHPDINATAYATFAALGFAIFASMVGIITGHIALWILFIIAYIFWCFYISLKVYFVRNVIIGLKNANAEFRSQGLSGVTPTKKDRFWIVLWGNLVNICMAVGLSFLLRDDFATYLLTLLLGNAILYTVIYMVMKKINGERISTRAAIFGTLSLITWCIAVHFFLNYLTDWKVTAAKSRQLNRECVLLGYYDYHDIWHLLSAPACFFSFMLLLCLDDDIALRPRSEIAVF